MNAAELLDRVFDIYKKSFWKQLAYAAIVGLMASTAVGFLMAGTSVVFMAASLLGFALVGALATVAVALVYLLLFLVWQAATSTGAILLSREAFMGRLVKLPTHRLFPTIGRAFSALLAQIIVSLPYVLVVGGILYSYFFWASRIYLTFTVVLVFVAVAGFFVYLHIFSLAIAVAVNERVLFFGAVRRSFTLIKNDFWWLLGIRMLWVVMVFILAITAQGLLAFLPTFVALVLAGNTLAVPSLLLLQFFAGLVSIAIAFALGPLDGILTTLIYFNQRKKYEDTADGV
jgi:hypothetical protein